VLTPYLLGWKIPEQQVFAFDVLVQMGTLVAVIIYFWHDLWEILRGWALALWQKKPFGSSQARLGWYIILATIPAGLLGILIKDRVEAAFNSVQATAFFLILTAAFLVAAELIGKRSRTMEHFNWLDALIMGLFQAVSIFPGVSRSGSTITGGMVRDLDRPAAARFSFLMSIPVMIAAGLVASLDLIKDGIAGSSLPVFLPGILVSGIVGYLSIRWLLGYLTHHRLYIFAIYVFLLGAVVLFVASSRPQVRTSPQPGEAFTVNISPEVGFLESGLRTCAGDSVSDALFINRVDDPASGGADLLLTFSAPTKLPGFSAQIGDQALVIITHPDNDAALTVDQLAGLYSGTLNNWPSGEPVTLWSYPEGSPLRTLFDTHILPGSRLATTARLAPGPEQMLEAVSEDPLSIGFIPQAWATSAVQVLDIDLPAEMHLPVLALASSEPQGALRDWLVCLQSGPYDTYLPLSP
jgi:undecaprenyl-diphosphatase